MKKNISLLLFCLLAFGFSSIAQEAKSENPAAITAQVPNTIKLKVAGLTCSGDIKDIQKQVTEIKGVLSCQPARKASATTLFEVTFNPELVSEKEIRTAVESTPGCSDPDSRPYKVKS